MSEYKMDPADNKASSRSEVILFGRAGPLSLDELPHLVIEHILAFFSYDEIAKFRKLNSDISNAFISALRSSLMRRKFLHGAIGAVPGSNPQNVHYSNLLSYTWKQTKK